jgi:hypothetical protein
VGGRRGACSSSWSVETSPEGEHSNDGEDEEAEVLSAM